MDEHFPLRLGAALLKGAVGKVIGDETIEVIQDAAPEKVQHILDDWLATEKSRRSMERAIDQADACFMQQVGDSALQQWMHDLPLRDLPALQKALDALPKSPNEDALEEALRQAIARDWPGLNQAQRDLAVRIYLLCVRRALLPLEEQALTVIGRSVLRVEEKLDRLQTQIQFWMTRERVRVDRNIRILGGAYQSVVISGDQNVVHFVINNYFVASIGELSPEQLRPVPLSLREEEKVYLHLLRDETDRVMLAEDERRSHKDRGERVALHRVYVDLATQINPTLDDVLDRSGIPIAVKKKLVDEMTDWFEIAWTADLHGIDVQEVTRYREFLLESAGDEDHPLNPWFKDKNALKQALAPFTSVEVLARERSLVLLGDPGSGKSTFVNHLAYTLAGAVLSQENDWREILENQFEAPLFPLRIVVRRWSGSVPEGAEPGVELVYRAMENLLNGLDRQSLWLRLSSPDTLVMFDGLDEAPIAESKDEFDRRGVILESIRQFRIAHPHCRMLVTSRVRPYENPDYQLPSPPFAAARLAPLGKPRIQRFVRQWYDELVHLHALEQDEGKNYADRLLNAIDRRSDLAEMAGSPLLLTMLAVVNRRAGLPEGRAELYHKVVRQLLWEWERTKAEEGKTTSLLRLLEEPNPPLKTIDLERALWELTYQAHARSGQRTADLAVDDLRKALVNLFPGNKHEAWAWASRVITLMQERSGLLIPVDDNTFTFPHRSFQEYLAARWLLELDDPGEEALELIENDIWHEVILLACGYLASQGPTSAWRSLVLSLADGMDDDLSGWQAPLLAGMAWREYGFEKLKPRTAKHLKKELSPKLTRIMQAPAIPAAQRLEAGLILADLGILPGDLDALIPIDAPGLGYAFRIGKYPVINAQYQRFVDAGGYDEDKPWWTKEAVSDLEFWGGWRNGPRYQNDSRFNKSTQPVVGVSWYEAQTYCQWLTERWREEGIIGGDEEVRLPTGQEWEAAAGPTRYAWGDDFDPANVNSKESSLGQTTPVHMYAAGATPAGVHDLNGNVWEWMIDDHETYGKVVRGGSWWNGAKGVTSSARDYRLPDYPNYSLGFRVVVVSSSR